MALYTKGSARWAMTERGRGRLVRDRSSLGIGPSSLAWIDGALVVDVDEVSVPIPRRVRGRVTLRPGEILGEAFPLDAKARHHWCPVSPLARVEVAFEHPSLSWSGPAYTDSNWGDEPLENGFRGWHWSRSHLADGSSAVLYDVVPRTGDPRSLALRFLPGRKVEAFEPPPAADLPMGLWRVPRRTRSERDTPPRVVQTLEDTPFYARSLLSAGLLGEPVTAVHESLSLDRFRSRWVKWLLPFRMPRLAR